MNKVGIKPHIPGGEDGLTITSSESHVSVTILLLHSLKELSFATLLTAVRFCASSNEGVPLLIF